MSAIKPTIGRKLYYWPSRFDREPHKPNGMLQYAKNDGEEARQPLDATILYVSDHGTVHLNVIDHGGVSHFRPAVTLVQDGDPAPTEAEYCYWMPFQVGQAKKAEGDTSPEKTALELGAAARAAGPEEKY